MDMSVVNHNWIETKSYPFTTDVKKNMKKLQEMK